MDLGVQQGGEQDQLKRTIRPPLTYLARWPFARLDYIVKCLLALVRVLEWQVLPSIFYFAALLLTLRFASFPRVRAGQGTQANKKKQTTILCEMSPRDVFLID